MFAFVCLVQVCGRFATDDLNVANSGNQIDLVIKTISTNFLGFGCQVGL